MWIGLALLLVGGIVLVLCIPGWAWAALLGAALAAIGAVLIFLGRR